MAKDPACLWYWGDWAGGTATFTRHLKGCYMDLLNAQFNSGPLSLDEIKTILGSDFGSSWPTLQKKFATTSNGLFLNERLQIEKEKRMAFCKSRADNLHTVTHKAQHTERRMENENRIENEKGNEDEKLRDYEKWTTDIHDGNDHVFQPMYLNSGLKLDPGRYSELVRDHFELLCRYPKMRPSSQQAFRNSVLKHLRENQTPKINGTTGSKNGQHGVDAAKRDFAERASAKSAGT